MSSTPAPMASPVLSVDGATPRGVSLVDERDKPIAVPKYNDTDDQSQPVLAADSGQVCNHLIKFFWDFFYETTELWFFFFLTGRCSSLMVSALDSKSNE